MVCSVGSGRMAVIASLLSAGSLSQNIAAVEAGQQKLAAQYIFREIRAADEPNLLDEEDMHVFGLAPMTDALHLVCCNACKKPVKASQYAAHSELCRSLISSWGMQLEVNGAVGRRKPPRKEKKKLPSAPTNHAMPLGEQQRSECIDASMTQLDRQSNEASFFLGKKDVTSKLDGKGLVPENANHSECPKAPPAKRLKLISRRHALPADNSEVASGLTKITTTRDQFSCRDFQLQSAPGLDTRTDNGVNFKNHKEAYNCSLLPKGMVVPLATKIYYSQRNSRLRSDFAHFYHVTSFNQLGHDELSPDISQETVKQLPTCSQSNSSHEQADDLQNRKGEAHLHELDANIVQSSEVCLDRLDKCPPFPSSQYPNENNLRPQAKRPFDESSGRSLGAAKQPKGSVSVL